MCVCRVFESRMSLCVAETQANYEGMRFREALKTGFYDMQVRHGWQRELVCCLCSPSNLLPSRSSPVTHTVTCAPSWVCSPTWT